MKHALIAVAGRARLVRIDAGNDQDLVLDLVFYLFQPVYVFNNGFGGVCRTWPDDQDKFIGFSGKYIFYFLIALCFYLFGMLVDRDQFFQNVRSGARD